MSTHKPSRRTKADIQLLPDSLRDRYFRLISPVTDFFIRCGLNPNWLTTGGLFLSIITTVLFATGRFFLGGIFIFLSGTFDVIDGKVARATNRVTKFGALYDSTLDRYSEVMIFFGMAYYFVFFSGELSVSGFNISRFAVLAVSIALGGSIMTSYVRARAEGLGLESKIGMMQRPERIVCVGLGAIFGKYALIVALIIIAVLSNFTAVQRLFYVWKSER